LALECLLEHEQMNYDLIVS